MANKIFIPSFISSITYQPARVLPHIYFYNGVKTSDSWYFEHRGVAPTVVFATQLDYFPSVDNYQGLLPTTGSRSLLFFNETSVYGDTPTQSLYSEYWSKYVELLYNPRTRLIDCSAIIPLADYFKMELNDIVEWRGNYYHLRAINDYNLSNGECNLQLLGPVLDDVIESQLPPEISCDFDFSLEIPPTPPIPSSSFYVVQCGTDTTLTVDFTSSLSMSIGNVFTWPSESFAGCWYVSSSFTGSPGITDVSISQSFATCEICSQSINPPAPPTSSFNYYDVDQYNCFPCSLNATGLVAIVTQSLDYMVFGNYYNNGDGYVYLVNTNISSASFDVDLSLAATAGTNCSMTCMI